MKHLLLALVLTLALCGVVGADTLVLDFEGLENREPLEDYYAGGYGRFGSGPGPDFGISTEHPIVALTDQDAGGGGNFANEPSPNAVMWVETGDLVTLNVSDGFTTALSFFYSNYDYPFGVVTVLSFNVAPLASASLPATGTGEGDPTGGIYGVWSTFSIPFEGTAHWVRFEGRACGYTVFDNLTFGSTVPFGAVPLPSAAWLGLGLLSALGILRHRRRRKAA